MSLRHVLTRVAVAAALAACGSTEAEEAEPPVAAPRSEESLTVQLEEVNGTGQTGAAVVAQTPAGLSVSVEVAVDDVHQLAAIAHGSCAELGLLYALIDADLALQRPDGLFRTDAVTRFEDAAPVTLEELASGSFAVVVADFETRSGGLVEALPAGTRLLEGPSGWETTPLAACGDIPAG